MPQPLAVKRGSDAGLVERERELETIEQVLGDASAGRGALLLVEGEAGIGKSALLAAAGRRARAAGLTVLAARGQEAEREFAFGGCLQLFERTVSEPARRDALLVGAAGLARPLLATGGTVARSRPPPDSDRMFGLLHGLYWLTAGLADEGPLLVLVDDAQWLDEPSLRFLRYLAVRIEELPVVLLFARRAGEPASGHLSALASEPRCSRLAPAPLSGPGVAALVRAAVAEAEPSFCGVCADLTGGNPLYLVELMAAIADAGMRGRAGEAADVSALRPRAVAASVLARVARHGPAAVELSRAVAVAGDGTALGRACVLASLDRDAGTEAADALAEAGVLVAGDPLAFVHPLVRAAVYDDIPAAGRARRHAQAACLLHREAADPELVSSQLLRASGVGEPWVIEQLRIAAHRALDRGVPAAATRYLERALDERPPRSLRAELLAECALAARLTGGPDALALLDEAIELTADRVERAGLLKTMGQALLDLGRMVDAAEAFERGLAELETAGDSELRATLRAGVEICGRYGSPQTASVDALDHALGAREPSYAGERSLLAFVAFQRGMALQATRDEVRAIARRALGDGQAFVDGDGTRAAVFLELALGMCEDYELVIDVSAEALRVARLKGSVLAHANASHALATARYRAGRLSEAVADATAACDADRFGWELYQPSARAILAEALLDRGEVEAAARALDVPHAGERWGAASTYFYFLAGRARLAFVLGRAQDALAGFRRCDELARAWGARNPAIYPWRSGAALAALRLGERGEARELAAAELADARAWGAPRPVGLALRTQGLIEGGDTGIELLREAAAELARSPSPVERARALVGLGAALRRRGLRREAREPLRQALDMARRCEAHALTNAALEELRASGARPRRLQLTGLEALTPMERRTATLAAEGLSNREVAQSLFLTVRTVEMHLTHAYRKLGVASRRELGRALAA